MFCYNCYFNLSLLLLYCCITFIFSYVFGIIFSPDSISNDIMVILFAFSNFLFWSYKSTSSSSLSSTPPFWLLIIFYASKKVSCAVSLMTCVPPLFLYWVKLEVLCIIWTCLRAAGLALLFWSWTKRAAVSGSCCM